MDDGIRLETQFLSLTGHPEKIIKNEDVFPKINIRYLAPDEVNKKR